VTGELFAGQIKWVDGLNAYTVRNLANRLFSGVPGVGHRLVRLGCLYSDAARECFLSDAFVWTGLPPGDTRSPLQAKADRRAYESIVRTANFCAAFRLDVACTRAVVVQALHVAERGNHLLVDTVLSAMRNDFEKHSVSATRKGKKTTMTKYAGYIRRFLRVGRGTLGRGRQPAPAQPPLRRDVFGGGSGPAAGAARRHSPLPAAAGRGRARWGGRRR